MIAFADIERAAIHPHALQYFRDKNVWVGVTVTVRICRKIVRNQIASNADILRDRLAMISGNAGREILRSLDAARCGSGDRTSASVTSAVTVMLSVCDSI
jgi:hypothetical protein